MPSRKALDWRSPGSRLASFGRDDGLRDRTKVGTYDARLWTEGIVSFTSQTITRGMHELPVSQGIRQRLQPRARRRLVQLEGTGAG